MPISHCSRSRAPLAVRSFSAAFWAFDVVTPSSASISRMPALEMIGEAQCQGNNSEGRIGVTAGRKDRAAGDVKIAGAMHLAIGVHHAVLRLPGHARCAHMMAAAPHPLAATLQRLPC